MKYLHLILLAVVALLSSCNDNDEIPLESNLRVVEEYLPTTVQFNYNDSDWKDKIKGWSDKKLIVNSKSEIPDDPFGKTEAFNAINFNEYTLLITYNVHDYTIDTYRNRYYRNNQEGTINWSICIKTADNPSDFGDRWFFTRYAILVPKLNADSKLKIWFSLGELNWNWDK